MSESEESRLSLFGSVRTTGKFVTTAFLMSSSLIEIVTAE